MAESGGSARLNRIVDSLFTSPLTTIPQAAVLTEVTYPTAKSDMERLQRLGIIREGPLDMTPRYFFSRELFDIAYGDG